MDLTTIEKPFGLLDKEAKEALKSAWFAGQTIEVFNSNGWDACEGPEAETDYPAWMYEYTYRVRPTPKPPAIELPWEVIDPRWKWVAMDANKTVHLYTHGIEATKTQWVLIEESNYRQIDDLFTDIRINVTDWKQSLTKRPE